MQDDNQPNPNNTNATPNTPQPVIVSSDTTQPAPAAPPQPVQPQPVVPANGQMQVGMSASQMGLNQPSKSSFNFKKLALQSLIGIVVLVSIFALLVLTNIVALSRFKTTAYTNSSGAHYSLQFYTKHTTKKLKTGSIALVSEVSEGGNYPITLSISSGPLSNLDKNGIKSCSGPLPKVFDVHNNSINQQISVCSMPSTSGGPVGVYVMGFAANNQANIVTISQDLSGVDLSSQSAAQQSLTKFGLDPYQEDIKQIVASIKVD